MRERRPDMLLGAGDVLSIEQADRAIRAGAAFLSLPDVRRDVVEYALSRSIPAFPGVWGTHGVRRARALGLTAVRLLFSSSTDGAPLLQSVLADDPGVLVLPAGGITLDTLAGYYTNDRVVACCCAFPAEPALVARNDYAEISRLCKASVYRMLDLTVDSILSPDPDPSGVCTLSDRREILASTATFRRALHFLKREGFPLDTAMLERDADGNPCAVTLPMRFGGLSVRLRQRP